MQEKNYVSGKRNPQTQEENTLRWWRWYWHVSHCNERKHLGDFCRLHCSTHPLHSLESLNEILPHVNPPDTPPTSQLHRFTSISQNLSKRKNNLAFQNSPGKEGLFFPLSLALKNKISSLGGQSVQRQHLGQRWRHGEYSWRRFHLCLPSLHMSFYKPCYELLTVIPVIKRLENQWIKVPFKFKSHHLDLGKKKHINCFHHYLTLIIQGHTAIIKGTPFSIHFTLCSCSRVSNHYGSMTAYCNKVIQTGTCSRTQIQIYSEP